ncbi:MAG: prolyl oligopeptidase family serine peptidase [Actinomycetota bacterium]
MSSAEFPRQQARTRRFTLGAPRNITVSPDGQRVVFLRSTGGDDPINRLWVHEIATGTATIVADPTELLADADEAELSPEEKARRERAREAGAGIVGYATDPDVTGAVFSLGGRLFSTDLTSGETAGLPAADGVFDPRPDPTGATVAYVAAGDLRVTNLDDGDRLVAGSDDPTITFGLADFIAAEEMRRSRGYWWAPDGQRLLVARVDSSSVDVWHVASPVAPATPPTEIRYPGAGTTNATVTLEIHSLDGTTIDVAWNPAGEWEYLADASWAPAERPTLVVQPRDQRTTAVLIVDASTGSCEEVYRWSDEHWTEIVPGAPVWIDGRLLTVEDRGAARRLVLDGESITGDDAQIRSVVQADADGILATASLDGDATEIHLVHVDLTGDTTRLTTAPGVHGASTSGEVVVASHASLDHDGSEVRILLAGEEVGRIENLAERPSLTPTVHFTRSPDHGLDVAVLLPEGAERDTPLPVLLDPYGGPHAQRVQKARAMFGASQWFADQGYAVVVADGRGTPGRGPAFERAVWGDLAQPVLDDQVEALDAAASAFPGLDLDRVGIRGWSFGGYLAALAVLRRPDRFHAAVAGAPVTDWRLYDTHYTERYLGHPDVHAEHYDRTDLTAEASSLERPLLLIHGLADDNVVVAHTLAMSRALLEAGRPHRVLPLSGVTHMTPQETVAENLLRLQAAFLDETLAAAHP